MKKACLSLIFLLTFLLTATAAKAQTDLSPFLGNWMLDLQKTNTTKDFPQKLKNYKMMVSGDQSNFSVKSQIEGNVEVQSAGRGSQTPTTESASRLGGARVSGSDGSSSSVGTPQLNYGGTMALFFNIKDAVYSVSGEEKKIETKDGTIRVKAKADKSGKILQFVVVRPFKIPSGTMEVTTREVWKLADDGKSMKLQRTVESSNWRDEIVMILNKVG